MHARRSHGAGGARRPSTSRPVCATLRRPTLRGLPHVRLSPCKLRGRHVPSRRSPCSSRAAGSRHACECPCPRTTTAGQTCSRRVSSARAAPCTSWATSWCSTTTSTCPRSLTALVPTRPRHEHQSPSSRSPSARWAGGRAGTRPGSPPPRHRGTRPAPAAGHAGRSASRTSSPRKAGHGSPRADGPTDTLPRLQRPVRSLSVRRSGRNGPAKPHLAPGGHPRRYSARTRGQGTRWRPMAPPLCRSRRGSSLPVSVGAARVRRG